jgi:predicted 3-demethylubiquinone-9 3-methyltransferase (glyoxalase superfamily)
MPARKPARKPSKPVKGRKSGLARVGGAAKGIKAAKPSPSAVRSITPFLWFDGNFEAAAKFYVSLFPDSRIDSRNPMGGSFILAGQRFMGLNGGPQYKFSPAVSFFVVCRDQKEVDRLWGALEKGGRPSRCGWIDDRFGLTWQIVPEAFLHLTGDPDPKKVGAVFQAMMGMVKMDVKGLQAAYDSA